MMVGAWFTPSAPQADPFPNDAENLTLADVDGDGSLDAVFCRNGPDVTILTNNGMGIFSNSGVLAVGSPQDMALSDMDGDVDLDLFVASGGLPAGNPTNANLIFLNDGLGLFSDSGQLLGDQNTGSVGLIDLNGDGAVDSAFGNSQTDNEVWFNDGLGVFSNTTQLLPGALTRSTLTKLGDVTGDGFLDLLIVELGLPIGNSYIKEWENDGLGTFVDGGQFDTSIFEPVFAGETGDLDGDGDLDFFAGHAQSLNRVWLNTGNGSFVDGGVTFSAIHDTDDVDLADVDGDGDLDALEATVNTSSNGGTRIWLNRACFNVLFTDPRKSAVDVHVDMPITVTFNDPVLFATVDTNTFVVQGEQEGLYSGTFSMLSNRVVQFDPDISFQPGEQIEVSLTSGIISSNGFALNPYVFKFYTEAQGCSSFVYTNSQLHGNGDGSGRGRGRRGRRRRS